MPLDYQTPDMIFLKPWSYIDSYYAGVLVALVYERSKEERPKPVIEEVAEPSNFSELKDFVYLYFIGSETFYILLVLFGLFLQALAILMHLYIDLMPFPDKNEFTGLLIIRD